LPGVSCRRAANDPAATQAIDDQNPPSVFNFLPAPNRQEVFIADATPFAARLQAG